MLASPEPACLSVVIIIIVIIVAVAVVVVVIVLPVPLLTFHRRCRRQGTERAQCLNSTAANNLFKHDGNSPAARIAPENRAPIVGSVEFPLTGYNETSF